MRKLGVFNSISLDGYFVDGKGDMSWAHNACPDPEWDAFVSDNASGGGVLLFGRITYELMASFWSTPMAAESMPVVAEQMNKLPKVVFSRKLDRVSWNNTSLVKTDLVTELRKLKSEPGADIIILGSGSIVSQLAQERLIDAYQFAVIPVVLGKGRTLFDGLSDRMALKLTESRSFANGNVIMSYEPLSAIT